MRYLAILMVLSAGCDWPFDYSEKVEWPGGAPEGCGNGVLDPDEMCDDGNRLDGDDCSANCFETPVLVLSGTTDGSQYDPDLAGNHQGLLLGYTCGELVGIEESEHVRTTLLTDVGRIQPFGEYAWDLKMNHQSEAFSQEKPSVALYGEYLVAMWMDYNREFTTGDGDVRIRKVDIAGASGDPEVVANENVDGLEYSPVMAGNGSSPTMIAAWMSSQLPPTDLLCRLMVEGLPSGSEFACTENTDGDEKDPAVAMAGSGAFVVAWSESASVYVRFFNADGTPASGDVQANTTTGGAHDMPSLAYDSTGRLLVTWRFTGPGGEPMIRARLFTAPDTPAGPDFRVNVVTMMSHEEAGMPDVAGDAGRDSSGVFIVVWYDNATGIRGRLVSGQNTFAVNRVTPHATGEVYTDTGEFSIIGNISRMQDPTVAVSTPGKALVAWVDDHAGTGSDIRGRIIPTN
jgi:cysteine-rich repeat protein